MYKLYNLQNLCSAKTRSISQAPLEDNDIFLYTFCHACVATKTNTSYMPRYKLDYSLTSKFCIIFDSLHT